MKHTVSLTVPNEKRYVPLCIDLIKNALRLAKIDDDDAVMIVAAARELIFNAISHAYPQNMGGVIDIDIRFLPHGVKKASTTWGFRSTSTPTCVPKRREA